MDPILIHYHMNISKHSSFVFSSYFNSEKFGSHYLNCPIPFYLQSGIRIVNSYPQGKQLFQLVYSAYLFPFLLPSVLQTTLISNVTQVNTFSLPPFSEGVSFICNTLRLFYHIIHSILRFPRSSKRFLKFSYTMYIIYAVNLHGF